MSVVSKDNLRYFAQQFYARLKGIFVSQEAGKGLSTNDYTTADKNKLAGIANGAQANVLEAVKVNGTAQTITDKAVNITVPTAVSQLTNDSRFITSADVPEGASASSTTPLMDGVASAGTETAFARGDHRHPSDTSKQDTISDLDTIRSGAAAGATAYQKPSTGIPKDDLSSAVQTSLGKADTAVQPEALSTTLGNYATTAAVETKISESLASVYKFKGTKATYGDLPTGAANGDVWNVTAAYGDYPAGTNFAWDSDSSAWDSLGGSFVITNLTNSEIDTIIDNVFNPQSGS